MDVSVPEVEQESSKAVGDYLQDPVETPPEKDYWVISGDCLVRYRMTPRTAMFFPTEENLPIPFELYRCASIPSYESRLAVGIVDSGLLAHSGTTRLICILDRESGILPLTARAWL